METRSSYVVVGSFVLLMVAALFVSIIYIAKIQLDEVTLPYHIYFDGSVTGLQEGSSVRYRGVAVGVVSDIRIAPDDASKVRVTVELPSSTTLTQDVTATIEMQGITGIAYIQLFGGARGSPALERMPGTIAVIPSRPSQISEVFDAAPQLLQNLVLLSDRAALFMTPENAQKLSEILDNTNKLTAQAGSVIDDFSRIANEGEKLSNELVNATKQARLMLSENREPIRDFTTTGLYDAALLIAELRTLVSSMSRVAAAVERDPSGFILAGPRAGVEPSGRNNNSSNTKNGVATQ